MFVNTCAYADVDSIFNITLKYLTEKLLSAHAKYFMLINPLPCRFFSILKSIPPSPTKNDTPFQNMLVNFKFLIL